MDEARREALRIRREQAAADRQREVEAASVAGLTGALDREGRPYRLHHPGDHDGPDWLRDRVPATITHLDWRHVDHEAVGLPEPGERRVALLRAWLADLPPDETLLVVTSNGANPMVALSVGDAARHAGPLLDLDPFELWLASDRQLIEFRWPDARRLSGRGQGSGTRPRDRDPW